MPLINKYLLSKRLKWILPFIIILTLLGIFRVFSTYQTRLARQQAPEAAPESTPESAPASLSLNRIHHTATRNGIKQWSLDAPSARYIEGKSQAIVDKPSVVFFLKDQKQVRLTADQGVLHTDSNDIELAGNVAANAEDFSLQAEHLLYNFKSATIQSRKPVAVFGPGIELHANSFSFDLSNWKAVLKGKIKGNFNESFF